jgi:hypothetical protein
MKSSTVNSSRTLAQVNLDQWSCGPWQRVLPPSRSSTNSCVRWHLASCVGQVASPYISDTEQHISRRIFSHFQRCFTNEPRRTSIVNEGSSLTATVSP